MITIVTEKGAIFLNDEYYEKVEYLRKEKQVKAYRHNTNDTWCKVQLDGGRQEYVIPETIEGVKAITYTNERQPTDICFQESD